MGVQSRADGQSFISCCGLNPGPAKWCLMKELAVSDTVQSAAPSHDQILHSRASMQLLQQMKKHFLETMLHGIREIHIALRDFSVWFARLAEELLHAMRKMPRQSDGSVSLDLHALIASQGHEVA